jgi:hypothetical protein
VREFGKPVSFPKYADAVGSNFDGQASPGIPAGQGQLCGWEVVDRQRSTDVSPRVPRSTKLPHDPRSLDAGLRVGKESFEVIEAEARVTMLNALRCGVLAVDKTDSYFT